MIGKLRSELEKRPWAGWAIALAIAGVAAYLYFFRSPDSSSYSPEAMTEMLTIRYSDTDTTEKIPRGRLNRTLRERKTLDPSEGITNPATGKPTGFLVDEKEWSGMLDRIKKERDSFQNSGKQGVSPLGEAPAVPSKPK